MKTFSIQNDTGRSLPAALLGLIGKAFNSRYEVLVDLPREDSMTGRRERTAESRAVEVELFGDGSGLEVAFWGLRCMFGVEEKAGAACDSQTVTHYFWPM